MGTADDIQAAVSKVVTTPWTIRNGEVVPESVVVSLESGAVALDAVYLYADMADSSGLVKAFSRETSAKVIRAFLDATCRVIKARGGAIRSFDGDRVMAIFIGDSKNSAAMQAGLNIKYVVSQIVRPTVEKQFPILLKQGYGLTHCVGIDSGPALLVRGGVRGDNDLVSVGRAPNVAAKLSEIREGEKTTIITEAVFNKGSTDAKYDQGTDGKQLMWERRTYNLNGEQIIVYRSSWRWKP